MSCITTVSYSKGCRFAIQILVVVGPVNKGIKLVIMQVLVMDKLILSIKPLTMDVVLIVGLIMKGSCQVAYQAMGKIIFHAKG